MHSLCHAGPDPCLPVGRRHPDVVPTKVGNHVKDWVPVFTGNPGFRLEFSPYLSERPSAETRIGIRGRNDGVFENLQFKDRL